MAGSEDVRRNLQAFQARTLAALENLGEHYAAKMEGDAKRDAPWTDRTGAARQGMFGGVQSRESTILVRLSGSEGHNVYLELANQGKYAVIEPTVKRHAPDFFKDAERVIRG